MLYARKCHHWNEDLSCVNIVTPAAFAVFINYPLWKKIRSIVANPPFYLFPWTQNKDTSQMITIALQVTISAQLVNEMRGENEQ